MVRGSIFITNTGYTELLAAQLNVIIREASPTVVCHSLRSSKAVDPNEKWNFFQFFFVLNKMAEHFHLGLVRVGWLHCLYGLQAYCYGEAAGVGVGLAWKEAV